MVVPCSYTPKRGPVEGERSLARFLRNVVSGALRDWGRALDSGATEDAYQEANLLFWRLNDRLAALPEPEQRPFLVVCVRHLVEHFLRRERRQSAQAISLDGLPYELRDQWVTLCTDLPVSCRETRLLEAVSDPVLYDALAALPDDVYATIDKYYFHEMTDREVGEQLGRSADAVRKQRNRALARLATTLSGRA